MTLRLELPDDVAARLATLLPEEDRDSFAVAAIAQALAARQREDEARLADVLLAEIDPEADPQREAAECRAAVDEELSDSNLSRNTVSLEEARRRWSAGPSVGAERQ